MKSDTTTTALNSILAVLVILAVVFAAIGIWHTHELRATNVSATRANLAILRAKGLAVETAQYNAKAKSPELTRILQSIQPKSEAK